MTEPAKLVHPVVKILIFPFNIFWRCHAENSWRHRCIIYFWYLHCKLFNFPILSRILIVKDTQKNPQKRNALFRLHSDVNGARLEARFVECGQPSKRHPKRPLAVHYFPRKSVCVSNTVWKQYNRPSSLIPTLNKNRTNKVDKVLLKQRLKVDFRIIFNVA